MQNFKEVLNIRSSYTIAKALNLRYEGQAEEEKPHATFGFSVPLITDDCPQQLQYFPLSKSSYIALQEDLNEEAFIEKMSNKRFCVIICNSFDRTDDATGQTVSLNPYNEQLSFIAGVWDATEDPLMAATLYSCTFLTVESENELFERVPYFLRQKQIATWLNNESTLEQRIELISSTNN